MSTMSATTSAVETKRPRCRHAATSLSSPKRCHSLPQSLEALDLSSSSPTPNLASLRLVVLTHLSELEERLSQLDSPLSDFGIEALKAKGESTVEDVRIWAKTGLEMLEGIRSDVFKHLPDLDLDFSVENIVNHLPDANTVPDLMNDVRSHLDIQMSDIYSRLPDIHLPDEVRSRIDEVRSRFSELEFQAPLLEYIPVLNEHLESLHAHLSSQIPTGINALSLAPGLAVWHDMLDNILSSDFYLNLKSSEKAVEDMFERATLGAKEAVQRSLNGARLIHYVDLPLEWRNNRFVTRGYRFIPLDKWPLIILSLFALHNETLNIHTHFIPFLLWFRNLLPALSDASADMPLFLFTSFALICLLSSTVYHTMTGCAHLTGMEICAKVDYVGIGWLISASVGSIVHYGLECHEDARRVFLALCFASGMAGTFLPFMDWFNKYEYRIWRVCFFLSLAFTAIAPVAYMSYLYSFIHAFNFVSPILPSIASYLIGLFFYVTNLPECYLSDRKYWSWLDWAGGGSHAIWHAFIVLAISQHRTAMGFFKTQGIQGMIVDGICVS